MINDNADKVTSSAEGKVPARRFPEFNDKWKNFPIGEVLKIGSGRDYKHLATGSIPVYGSGGLMTYVDKFLYEGESVCIGRKGTIDNPMLLSGKFWTVDTLFYTYDYKNLIPKFLFNIFQQIDWRRYSEASGVPSLSKSIIESIEIYIPSGTEQEKIAACLSSIDNLIGKKQAELESLKKYKDGLLQQLFPQGNNNLPALRFPEFKNSPPWQETKLERICRSISSGRDKRSDDGNYDLFGSTGIIGKTSDKTYNGKFILVARVGANAGLLTKVNSIFGATDNTLVIDLDDNTNIDFIFASLDKFRLNRLVFGSGQPLITGRQLKDISISLPDSTEQKKIANCLTSLDNLIEIKQQELDKLSRYKKGLLQQLLVQG